MFSTVMRQACTTGTIKLPLLLIGKSKNPCCFKNVRRDTLPVVYGSQSNAWVDATLFTHWFHHEFGVALDYEPTAVLLLNNCSAHPDEEELISADRKVIPKLLPPNVIIDSTHGSRCARVTQMSLSQENSGRTGS